MGNRATIKSVNSTQTIYLHWQGGRGSIKAFIVEAIRRDAGKQLNLENYTISKQFIFELYGCIRDFMSFGGEKEYRGRDALSIYIITNNEKCDSDNGHYRILKNGSIDFSESNYIETKDYTKNSFDYITEFFKQWETQAVNNDKLI